MELSQVIIKPYHTEKSFGLRKFKEKSTLTFLVDRRADKNLVKLAFISIYGTTPEKINIVNRKSQAIKTGTAKPGRSKQLKIAYIILPKGIEIAITKDEIEEAAKRSADSQTNSKGVNVNSATAKEIKKTTVVKETKHNTTQANAKTVVAKKPAAAKKPTIRKTSSGK